MAYSDYFQFGADPTMQTQQVGSYSDVGISGIPILKNSIVTGGLSQGDSYNSQGKSKAASMFDQLMAGHDATSNAYIAQLQAINKNYGKYASEYKGDITPIIEAMTGDISKLSSTSQQYADTLAEIKPSMMNGINIDPNASRTRNEYMGNVADQIGAQEKAFKINAESQGQNPYANTGANREFALTKGAGLSGAANKAYTDWRTNYNKDVQADQNAKATYAGLVGNQAGMQSNVISARGQQAGLYGNILSAQTNANSLNQQGTSDLLGVNEARRQEGLQLGLQKQNNVQRSNEIVAGLKANDPTKGLSYSAWGGY